MEDDDFLEFKLAESFIVDGAGIAMGADPEGKTYYVLHLEGYHGHADKKGTLDVVIPPMFTEAFLKVVKAMEAKRE